MKWQRLSLAADVQAGNSSRDDADASLRSIAKQLSEPKPDQRFVVTVSASGNRLYYRKEDADNVLTVVYDGDKTYNYEKATHRLDVSPGLKFGEMLNFPLPAVGIPSVPLIQPATNIPASAQTSVVIKGDALQMNASDIQGGAQYLPGELVIVPDGRAGERASTLTLFHQDYPIEKWEFLSCQPFKRLLVAIEMRWTSYAPVDFSPVNSIQKPWGPAKVIEYHLLSASEVPVVDTDFDPANLVGAGDQVQQNTEKGSTAFVYSPKVGTMTQQMSRQPKSAGISSETPTSQSKIGGLLIGVLVCGGGAWFIWKRNRRA